MSVGRFATRAVVAIAALLMAGAALAGAVPVGGEFQINTFTAGNQFPTATQTSGVAADDAGNFVAVWASSDQDGSLEGIYGQRFAASGVPIGAEFRVNTTTYWRQTNPVVAMGPSGNFVVVWQDLLKDGDSYGIYLQRYDSSGNPVGVETRVNDTTGSFQVDPSIGINSSGEFVVCWASNAQDGSLYGVYAKRYNADGTQKGPEFHVSTHTLDNQAIPNLALDDLGRFVITWSSRGQDGSGYGVYFQQFDAAGAPVGIETRANSYTSLDQLYSTVGLDASGNFAISWTSTGQDGDSDGIYARRFDWQGNAFGPEFLVNTQTAGRQYIGKLAMNDAGGVLVTWRSPGQDGSDEGVYAQLFDANGVPNGGEFRVNTTTLNLQASESAAYVGNRLMLIWLSAGGQDGSGFGVFGQRYLVCDPLEPSPVVTPTQNSVCPGATSSASVQAAYAGYSWSITNGTIQGANDLSSVTFTAGSSGPVQLTVAVTDGAGCSATANAAVNVFTPAAATVTASGPTTFCEGGNVTLTASTGASYLWSNGATTQSIAVNASGSYSVTIADANGCSATSSATSVTVNPLPVVAISASGPTTFCEGGSVTLTASPSVSYLWSNGATTQSITVNASGSFSVTVTDANGCCATSSATNVTANPLPTATIAASGPTTFCEGGNVTLTASAGASYLWSNGATTQSITVNASGSYSVTMTDANGCSATSSATSVTVNPLPLVSITASGPTTFCEGGNVTLTASAGASYLWSNGATTQSITANASGSYSVTVADANGCSATSSATSVTVNPLPVVSITASGPTTFCEGGNVTLTASAGASYLWSNGATTQSITVNASGSYSVTMTDANGCSATSSATNVTVNPLPQAQITASSTTICAFGTVTLTASPATSYLWSNGATTQSITVSAAGTYSVTASGGSCSKTSETVTIVEETTTVSISGSDNQLCPGESVTVTSTVNGTAASYQWYGFAGQELPGETGASLTITPQVGMGYYTLRVTTPAGCVVQSNTFVYTVTEPEATITANGPTTFCEGSSVDLSAPDQPGYSWLWSTGATSRTINVAASGSYSVTVTNANGCSKTSAPVVVTVNANPATPVITASGPTTFCQGGSVTLTASAADNYLWSNGATTQSISVNASGWYSVTVTNASGCSVTSSPTEVVVNANPATPIITASGPTTFCQGGSVTLTAPAAASYLWSNGATTQSISVSASGSFSVTVTSAAGCSATSAPSAVTVHPLPAATITASGPTTFCQGGSVTLTAPAGLTYLWSNGASSQSIVANASGSYSVTVTNGNGCSATSAPVTVTVNPQPAIPVVSASGPTTFCNGGSVTLTAPAGFTYLWSNGATAQSVIVSTSGSYSVTVTNGSGCSSTSAPTSVTVTPSTAITQQPQSVTIPKNTSHTLTVVATGTGTLTYQWYRGTSGNTANPISGATSSQYNTGKLTRGTYSYWVRVTGTCGSVNSSTATVTAQ